MTDPMEGLNSLTTRITMFVATNDTNWEDTASALATVVMSHCTQPDKLVRRCYTLQQEAWMLQVELEFEDTPTIVWRAVDQELALGYDFGIDHYMTEVMVVQPVTV